MKKKIIVIGAGNAALCAGIAALEKGGDVLILERANKEEAGGNSRYTAGAMRFVYNSNEELIPLLLNLNDKRLPNTEFGTYSKQKFQQDFLNFNNGRPLSLHQNILIDKSYETLLWLSGHNIKFEPIYSRQAFQKNGKYTFWGGLTLAAKNEGVGLVDMQMERFLALGGKIQYETEAKKLLMEDNKVVAVKCQTPENEIRLFADSIILACGGFEANSNLRKQYMGQDWTKAKVRGTKHNMGKGLEMALDIGADFKGLADGCHAVPMDLNMPDYGNLDIPHIERKQYRKICYFLGIMLNCNGQRFVDEGINFRNYTYAQFGKAILNQPNHFAWQVFDKKVEELLYSEYRFWDASYVEADTLEDLTQKLEGVDAQKALKTIQNYNQAVDKNTVFDPSILDGKNTKGLALNKTNWANSIDSPPFKAYPVTCGITFTYGGLKVDENARVLDKNNVQIEGLFACGELVGGIFIMVIQAALA